ncbi:MAG TPA: choice-of-anchor Q domain-containing protein, partial [Lacipirellulaceae bacterium]
MATRRSARQAARRRSRRAHANQQKPLYRRTLRYEPLEDRRLLALVTVNTPLDIVDLDDGLTSLREAIFATNLVSGPDEITFDFGHDGPETILLTQGELRISDDLTITGPGAEFLTIDASGNDPTPDRKEGFGSRILNINDGNSAHLLDVVINGLVLTGGDIRGDGGAIVSNEHLTILYCTFSQNWTSGDGGAIYSERGNLTISGSTITANSGADHGGGVSHIGDFSIARTVTVIDSTINGNSTTRFDGGGINVENASVVIQGSIVSGNSACREGGGIYLRNRANFPSRLEITESTISGNTTESRGGGGISSSGINGNNLRLIASASVISGNSVGGWDGGGILSRYCDLTVSNSTITDNSAKLDGGGISARWGHVNVTSSTISGNSAQHDGGGVYGHYITVDDTTISGNSTVNGRGGGIFVGVDLTLSHSTVSDNSSGGDGGGIEGTPAFLKLVESIISGNTSKRNGGGINSSLITAIENSTISGNSASRSGGGIYSRGPLTLMHCIVEGNSAIHDGGGIAIFGTGGGTSITDTSIIGNSAALGGGIHSQDKGLTLTAVTMSGNSARGNGGGILILGPELLLINSTVSGNTAEGAGGGLYLLNRGSDVFSIDHSTIVANSATGFGGGIAVVGGGLQLNHSIVARNEATFGQDLTPLFGSAEVRFSLIGRNSQSELAEAPVGSPDANGNLVGGPVHGAIDPLLSPLAANGGPTMTHALLPGSPAINAGDLNAKAGEGGVPLYDQRGEPFGRVVNGRIDIGAFEYQEASDLNLLVDTLDDESDGDHGRGDLSLREAIELANLYPSDDTIRFDPGLTAAGPATILLTMGELRINDDVSVEGPGAEFLTIDASGNDPTPTINDGRGSRVFSIFRGETFIGGLTLTGGDVGDISGSGGAISSNPNVTIADCFIIDNSARGDGGAVYSRGRSLTVIRSIISGNSANGDGGGIRKESGTLVVEESTLSNNTTRVAGGGISAAYGAQFHVRKSHLRDNSAYSFGGALQITYGIGESTIEGSVITDNSAGDGGGIWNLRAKLAVMSSVISDNSTEGWGGGIHSYSDSDLTLISSLLSGNMASSGGAIATSNEGTRLKSLTLVDTTIINNYASFYGGGIFADRSNLTAIGTTISDNAANRIGGGIAFRDPGLPVTALSLTQCTISGNQSKQHGGGVYIYHHPDSQHTISHSTIAFNVSDADDSGSGSGGGLFIRRGSIDIDHSIIAGNLDRTEVGPDLTGSVGTTLVVTNSLIGTNTGSGLAEASAGSPDANGNIIGGPVHGVIDPQLGSLTDNGGPTPTHALLP